MSSQACLRVCKKSSKWRLLTRQELLWARSEDRIILMWSDFFSPLYLPTFQFFFFFFGAILKELYLHLSVSQALPRGEWDSWRTGKVGISMVSCCFWGHRGLCLAWGCALGLLLLHSLRKNFWKLTALLENAPEFPPESKPMAYLSLLWQHSLTLLNRETCTVVLYQMPLACASKRETEMKSPELTMTAILHVQFFLLITESKDVHKMLFGAFYPPWHWNTE